ncbi:BLUF domain-containing protein [Rhodosalinus sp.]|uniref:BLUF domain-containing protein n=1 Tax=Rhodosalinus sp. TaxID=2047741 RepID=UPI00397AA3AB
MPSDARGMVRRLSYRSEATRTLDAGEIGALAQSAAARNAERSITGALISNGTMYRQWIEGPGEVIEALLDALRRDPRHDALTVTEDARENERAFAGWHMQLFQSVGDEALAPEAILLGRMAPSLVMEDWGAQLSGLGRAGLVRKRTPELSAAQADAIAAALVVPEDDGALARVMRPFLATAMSRAVCYERVARALGDGWMADRWGMAEITLALGRFQMLLWNARMTADPVRPMAHAIVANQPGNPHFLGAVLKADVLRASGWAVSLLLEGGATEIEGAARHNPGAPLLLAGSRLLAGISEGPLQELSERFHAALPGTPLLIGHRGAGPLAFTADRLRRAVAATLRPGTNWVPQRGATGAMPLY